MEKTTAFGMEETTTQVASLPPVNLGWPLAGKVVFGVAASAVLLVAVLGNLTVLHTFARTRRLHTYANIYIAGLALADLLLSILVTPLHAAYRCLGYWPFGSHLCLYFFQIIGTCVFHTSYLMTPIIAVDRYISVAYPIKHLSYRSTKIAQAAIFLAYFSPVCLWCPFFFFYWEFLYEDDFAVPPTQCASKFASNLQVTVAVVCVHTWAPIGLVAIVYAQVYRIARVASAGKKQVPVRESAAARTNPGFALDEVDPDKDCDHREEIDGPLGEWVSLRMGRPKSKPGRRDASTEIKAVSSRNKMKKNKALRTLTPIFVSMMLSGLPWATVVIVFVICPTCLPTNFAVFLTRTFGAINPFCYAIANPLYRRAFLQIVCAKRNTRRHSREP